MPFMPPLDVQVDAEILALSSEFFATALSQRWCKKADEEEERAVITFVGPTEDMPALPVHVCIHITHGCGWKNCCFLRRIKAHLYAEEG